MTTGSLYLSDRDGKVVLEYGDTSIVLEPEVARDLSEKMARSAYKARFGSNPTTHLPQNIEALRQRLTLSVTHILRSLQEQGKHIGIQAQTVVDTCLNDLL